MVVRTVLTDLERRRIRSYMKTNGERTPALRGLATRCRQYLPTIREDLALIEEFVKHYQEARLAEPRSYPKNPMQARRERNS